MAESKGVTFEDLLAILPSETRASERKVLADAYEFALNGHEERRRSTGVRHIDHALAVAYTIAELKVDAATTTASLLIDILHPHTGWKSADIDNLFSEEVCQLVTGLDKLTPYTNITANKSEKTLESMRRAMLTVIEDDVRIILIQLADSLHDLRHAKHLTPDHQKRIAEQAHFLYAPIANQLGVWQLKWEIEDLSFRYLQPETYMEIANYLAERRAARMQRIEKTIELLQDKTAAAGFEADISGRPKHIYSIFRKMDRKKVPISEIYDLRAVRIIIEQDETAYCYQALGIVHGIWKPIPEEFDDYIAWPKPNGYQSLHTAVLDENNQILEVQIRTRKMHENAERGIAAHWAYKEGGKQDPAFVRRLGHLRHILNPEENPAQVVDGGEETADSANIYIFTPVGDVVEMSAGTTPVDLAYQIHSELGHRCRGAKANGKMVNLNYKLETGDTVEIITVKRGGPSRDWMNESSGYTGNARTRSKIRSWFRAQDRETNVTYGRQVVERALRENSWSSQFSVKIVSDEFELEEEELLARVGFGDISTNQIYGAIDRLRHLAPKDEPEETDTVEMKAIINPAPRKPKGLTVLGMEGLHTRVARCCAPIPPEPIIGFITRGRGVTVHRRDCSQIKSDSDQERLVPVDWGIQSDEFSVPFIVKSFSQGNLQEQIASFLKGQQLNLIKIKSVTKKGVTTFNLLIQVQDAEQVTWIRNKLEALPNVFEVISRQEW